MLVNNFVYIILHNFFTGILEREQEQSVVYGSIDFGKTIVTNEKYKELVGKLMYFGGYFIRAPPLGGCPIVITLSVCLSIKKL